MSLPSWYYRKRFIIPGMPMWTASPRDCCERTTHFRRYKCPVEGIMFAWLIRTARSMQERSCRRWRYLAVSSGVGCRDPNIQHPTSNIQRSTKHQVPNRSPVEGWNLELLWSLDVDAWSYHSTIRSCSNPGTSRFCL